MVQPDDNEIIAAIVSNVNIVPNMKKWAVDSGATRYVCADRKAFSSNTTIRDEEEIVYMRDSRMTQVIGKGKVLKLKGKL